MVRVKLAELTKQIKVINLRNGTTLSALLEKKKISGDRSVRVNGKAVPSSYRLNNGDIITVVGHVSGGV